MAPYSQSNRLRALRIYLSTAATLHLAWEVLQLPLYTIWRTGDLREIAFAILHCTAGDLMIASLSLLTALLVFGNRSWPTDGFIPVMVVTLVIGVSYTIYSEWVNTVVRKIWTYSPLMPTLPVLGTGLSPLMQWLMVPVAGFAAIRRKYKRMDI